MCFTLTSPTNGFYIMNDAVFELVNSFNDFGTNFDWKLDFRDHITSIVSRAKCVLGVIKWWAKELSNSYVTKQLFTTLVRSILVYGSVIWCCTLKKIKSIQIQFLLFYLRHLGNEWDPNKRLPSYEKLLVLIKIVVKWSMLSLS